MGNALQSLLSAVANVASGFSPAAKTIVAAVLPLASALLNMLLAGSFNVTSLVVLATGAVVAVGVYFVPNKPKVAKPTLKGGAGIAAGPPVPGPTPPPPIVG